MTTSSLLGRRNSFTNTTKADPKLAKLKDDDGRLPIHWAVSSNQLEIVRALVQTKDFDPDVQVRCDMVRRTGATPGC